MGSTGHRKELSHASMLSDIDTKCEAELSDCNSTRMVRDVIHYYSNQPVKEDDVNPS